MIRQCRELVQNVPDVGVGIDFTTPATRDDRVDHCPFRFFPSADRLLDRDRAQRAGTGA